MHTTQFNIDAYLAEYLLGKWGVPHENDVNRLVVQFPREIYLFNLLHSLTMKRPKHVLEAVGNIEVIIPFRKEGNKRPEHYNYISNPSAKLFNKKVTQFFRADLHEFLDNRKHVHGESIKDACFQFVAMYQIESIDPESLAKNYYRWKGDVRGMNRERRAYLTR